MMRLRRLQAELRRVRQSPVPGILDVAPEDDGALDIWTATLEGPEGSPYQGGHFGVRMRFTDVYPAEAPQVHFITRLYHPNINVNGSICLDVLQTAWSPALTVMDVLDALRRLLVEPNPHDPLVPEIATLYSVDRAACNAQAAVWTATYAVPDVARPSDDAAAWSLLGDDDGAY